MKCNTFVREEEVKRFLHRYTEFVKSPNGHAQWSNREMRVAFRAHFRDRFARCPGLPLQEFHGYLAYFPWGGGSGSLRGFGYGMRSL